MNSRNTSRSPRPSRTLLVVESPNKVKTIQKFLDDSFVVRATVGHIADIPENAPIDIENGFDAQYEPTEKGAAAIADLREAMTGCDRVVIATDDDREGEMIASHVLQFVVADAKVEVQRIVFHSVSKDAVLAALESPRDIDWNVVEAARTRRVLDRLFGFEVTAVTRRMIRKNVTAGRVQSPGLCLVVERELERMAFVAARYMDVRAETATDPAFTARLATVGGKEIATGADFDDSGALTKDVLMVDDTTARSIADRLTDGTWELRVTDVTTKDAKANPRPPFDMSSLYQEAEYRLGMSTGETKTLANRLHEGGLITYPRADVKVHSADSRKAIRAVVREIFGADMVSPYERYTKDARKNTQGAHEAIRPVNLRLQEPKGIGERAALLYRMIWQRTMASQMVESKGIATKVTMLAGDTAAEWCEFTATGTQWTEPGFRTVYDTFEESVPFPALSSGDVVPVSSVEALEHFTKAPPRYVAASLIKKLEDLGIGRPSTYDSIIAKLRDRFVWSKRGNGALIPTLTAFATYRLLNAGFAPLVDYGFTRDLESELDGISADRSRSIAVLSQFWFDHDGTPGLHTLILNARTAIDLKQMYVVDLGVHPGTGEQMIVRPGKMRNKRFSPYIECGSVLVPLADETCFDDFTAADAIALIDHGGPRSIGVIDGVPLYVVATNTGAFFKLGDKETLPKGSKKPLTAPLMKSMDPARVTVDDAETMFSLPRTVGARVDTGEPILAKVGPYGGYVQCGDDRRSLKDEMHVFSVTEDEANALFDVPKKPRFARKKGGRRKS